MWAADIFATSYTKKGKSSDKVMTWTTMNGRNGIVIANIVLFKSFERVFNKNEKNVLIVFEVLVVSDYHGKRLCTDSFWLRSLNLIAS